MKKTFIFLVFPLLLSCNQGKNRSQEQEAADENAGTPISAVSLELVWASDSVLMIPESVLFDEEREILYIANLNQDPWVKDGDGFLSRMDLEGNILDLRWVEGLSGPKGMGLFDHLLYVADIDEIVEIDAGTGEILNKYPVEGDEPYLNDVTVGEDGSVYVSGSNSNIIYALKDGEVGTFYSGEGGFNGLYWEPERLLLLTSGSSQFMAIDWEDLSVTVISENMEAGDGIVNIGKGDYLTSSWSGSIFHVASDGRTTKILNTEDQGENAADFDYSSKDNLLFVPTFFDNRVKAYRLVR